ncbi:hypothetical protein QVD17_06848 [Tagetes erecta]|uniref:Reverse transcriptase n=1 Tax=Tagetes erecta TaxID=13708 RepID=A0AAD8LML0_TARER|nr:hypothetical protein QVD17_06848 [Tagetes erecta]
MEVLRKFAGMSGLSPNMHKSTVFFCHVPLQVKNGILNRFQFIEGKLPVKYLGVPLISSRLNHHQCRELTDRLEKRISSWDNKLLSFAGRLQLVRSVLSSMHIFWAAAFMIPSYTAKEIEAKLRNFLWGSKHAKKVNAKVS